MSDQDRTFFKIGIQPLLLFLVVTRRLVADVEERKQGDKLAQVGGRDEETDEECCKLNSTCSLANIEV